MHILVYCIIVGVFKQHFRNINATMYGTKRREISCKIPQQYLANSSLHGTRYLVEDDRHWTERIFWFFVCGLSWFGCAVMIKEVFLDYRYNSVDVTVDTLYLDWQVKFPSVSVCPGFLTDGQNIIDTFMNKKFKTKGQKYNAKRLFSDQNWGFVRGSKYFDNLTGDDLAELNEKVQMNCSDIFRRCLWNGERFNCCNQFHRIKTMIGTCFILNNYQVESNKETTMDFMMNRTTGAGELDIEFNSKLTQYNSFLLNNYEIPTTTNPNDGNSIQGMKGIRHVGFTLQDVENVAGMENVAIHQRKCRFPWENEDLVFYKLYNYNACISEIWIKRMIEYCGCVGHLFPHPPWMKVCNHSELECISKAKSAIVDNISLKGQCISDCEGTIIFSHANDWMEPTADKNAIIFHMLSLPSIRYKRYFTCSLLDVVVSVGSAAGLFMGASVLSLVEIPYWLLLRGFFR
ncbi:pickpocket protein 11 [Cephus cinctus]|uniref:Pickpocket protein 11 n=1 Tax=Cephus cinctus TaxID=211228 RepID=A0AAJ7BZI5_CEPCN|nr:pickpocket protein 11 [Cephus cinctus]